MYSKKFEVFICKWNKRSWKKCFLLVTHNLSQFHHKDLKLYVDLITDKMKLEYCFRRIINECRNCPGKGKDLCKYTCTYWKNIKSVQRKRDRERCRVLMLKVQRYSSHMLGEWEFSSKLASSRHCRSHAMITNKTITQYFMTSLEFNYLNKRQRYILETMLNIKRPITEAYNNTKTFEEDLSLLILLFLMERRLLKKLYYDFYFIGMITNLLFGQIMRNFKIMSTLRLMIIGH